MTWKNLSAEIAAEFHPGVREWQDGTTVFRRVGREPGKHPYKRDARGRFVSQTGKRRKYRGHRRKPELVALKQQALTRLSKESARAVALALGVNRATVNRWAREEGLRLRRGRHGCVDWRKSWK